MRKFKNAMMVFMLCLALGLQAGTLTSASIVAGDTTTGATTTYTLTYTTATAVDGTNNEMIMYAIFPVGFAIVDNGTSSVSLTVNGTSTTLSSASIVAGGSTVGPKVSLKTGTTITAGKTIIVKVFNVTNASTVGTKSFYWVQTANGGGNAIDSWPGTPSITLTPPPNHAPAITESSPQAVTMSEDGSPTAFSLTLHATDSDSDTITWSVSTSASHGSATASGTGTSKNISYTPTANYSGSDSFIVTATDSHGADDNITVNVTVEAINDSPSVATNTGATVAIGSTKTITHSMLKEGDPDDEGAELIYTLSAVPSSGGVWVDADSSSTQDSSESNLTNGGTFTQEDIDNNKLKYTALTIEGSDSFTFSLEDGGEDSAVPASGTFNITIVQPILSYTNTLIESSANDGSVDGSIVIALTGDKFNNVAGATATSATGLDGLNASFSKTGDTQVTLTFTGNKSHHDGNSSLSDIVVTFDDASFTEYLADRITDFTKSGFSISFFDGFIKNLQSNNWNMAATSNGYSVDTSEIDSSYLTTGKSIWSYSSGSWSINPTSATPKTGLWIHPTGTDVPFNGTTDSTNNIDDKTAQFADIKSLSINSWHLIGVQSELKWDDFTRNNVTPSGCGGYSLFFYYNSENNSWNSTTSIPANGALWVRHICSSTNT